MVTEIVVRAALSCQWLNPPEVNVFQQLKSIQFKDPESFELLMLDTKHV